MNRRPFILLSLAALIASGCTSFTQAVPVGAIPEHPDPKRRFQVWVGGEHHELHAVRPTADSLAGVPYWRSPTCDSCRVVFRRSEIDSVRTLGFDGGETGILAILLIPLILALYIGSRIPTT